jgi:oligopeptide transport system substrate-binding protein
MAGTRTSLDPIRAVSSGDRTVIVNLYENLMRLAPDRDGKTTVVSGAAKSYNVDEHPDGTVTYTFHLRSAKWSDGVDVTASNFVYAWQRLADPATDSPSADILSCVSGYDKVRSGAKANALAVRAVSDDTLSVTLTGQCPWFLTDVCTAAATMPLRQDVVRKLKTRALAANQEAEILGKIGDATWCSDPAALVTNGCYRVSAASEDSDLLLTENSGYSGTFHGPESIQFLQAETPENAQTLFQSGKADFVSPVTDAGETATLADTGVLLFNTVSEPFDDPLIRKAFALAVNRSSLAEQAGTSYRPATGLVPDGVPGDDPDFRTAGGDLTDCNPEQYDDDCQRARSLLEQAGCETGELKLLASADDGGIARILAQMLSNALKIPITAEIVTAEKQESILASGKYTLALRHVTALANDPQSFLDPWRSNSDQNVTGYCNSAYDTLLTVIGSASDEGARRGCLHDAESLLLEDCPLTPLFFSDTAWAVRDGLTGVCRDARGWFLFSSVAGTAST